MKNRLLKIMAIAAFVITIPLLPIEAVLGRSGNLFLKIRQNFQVIMFTVSLIKCTKS